MLLADAYTSRSSDGTYAKNSMEAIPAISCLDDPEGIKPAQVPAEYPAFEEASPTFGRVFAWGLVACRNWPPARGLDTEPLDDRRRRARRRSWWSAPRATPRRRWSWAQALASQLDSGVLVDPRRRRPHRLQLRQRLRRRRRRVLPDRGRRPARRPGLLSRFVWDSRRSALGRRRCGRCRGAHRSARRPAASGGRRARSSAGGGGEGGVDAVHDGEGLVLPRPQ